MVGDYSITGPIVGGSVSYFLNCSAWFMAKYSSWAEFAVDLFKVRSADSARLHLDENIAGGQFWSGDFFDCNIVWLLKKACEHVLRWEGADLTDSRGANFCR